MAKLKPRAEVPDFIIQRLLAFREPDVWDDELVIREDILYAVGGALVWVRLAASMIEEVRFSQHGAHRDHVARYHTYAGVSAAHTCIDTITVWIYEWLKTELPPFSPIQQSLSHPPFFKAVIEIRPDLKKPLEKLRSMLAMLGDRRQSAQHRGDVRVLKAVMSWPADASGATQGAPAVERFEDRWYFYPADRATLRSASTRMRHDIAHQLREWATRIEKELRMLTDTMPWPAIDEESDSPGAAEVAR